MALNTYFLSLLIDPKLHNTRSKGNKSIVISRTILYITVSNEGMKGSNVTSI